MITDAIKSTPEAKAAYDRGDTAEAQRIGTHAVLSGLMGALSAAHATGLGGDVATDRTAETTEPTFKGLRLAGTEPKASEDVTPAVDTTEISHLPGIKATIDRVAADNVPANASIDHLPGIQSAIEKSASETASDSNSLAALKAALDQQNSSVGAAGIADDFSNRAANINLDRLQTGEDVLGLIRSTAKSANNFEAQRRGTISHEETAQAAEDLGLTARETREPETRQGAECRRNARGETNQCRYERRCTASGQDLPVRQLSGESGPRVGRDAETRCGI